MDVQDANDETPLFLAAREGNCRAAQVLLDYGANRDIADGMNRLPRHIALERLHFDIIKLLYEHCATSPGMVMANSYAGASGSTVPAFMRHSMVGKQKSRRRSRHANSKSTAPPLVGKTVKLPPEKAVKRTRKKKVPRDGSTGNSTLPDPMELPDDIYKMLLSYESAGSEVPQSMEVAVCMNEAMTTTQQNNYCPHVEQLHNSPFAVDYYSPHAASPHSRSTPHSPELQDMSPCHVAHAQAGDPAARSTEPLPSQPGRSLPARHVLVHWRHP